MSRFVSLLSLVFALLVFSSEVLAQQPQLRSSPFDSFGAINSEDASARLDNFAIVLQQAPEMVGYLVSYGPKGETSGSAHFRLQVMKEYLLNRGIEPEQIRVVNAGRYKDPAAAHTELWVVPAGEPFPEPKRYDGKPRRVSGKFADSVGYDSNGVDECGCGPGLGDPTRAAFRDVLEEQKKDVGYIVAFNFHGASPGNWRRVAKYELSQIVADGINTERVKIIYGGATKAQDDDYPEQVRLEYWVLPSNAPQPIKEAKQERRPKTAVVIGSYYDWSLKKPEDQQIALENIVDVLRADTKLGVCIIVRSLIPDGNSMGETNTGLEVDPAKLADKWKSELQKLGIGNGRIFVLDAGGTELGPIIETWVVPPGASLPDPHAPDENADTESQPA